MGKKEVLPGLKGPADLKGLSTEDLELLCGEIRQRIIEATAVNGGHVGPNLYRPNFISPLQQRQSFSTQLAGQLLDLSSAGLVSGVRAHPDIEACFTNAEGWLPLLQPGGVPTQLRIVPVLRPADGSRMPAAWSARGSDGIAQIWTVYMNVEREAHQNVIANGKVPEEMREAFAAEMSNRRRPREVQSGWAIPGSR